MEHEKTIGFEIRLLNNLIKRDVERSKPLESFHLNSVTGLHCWAIGWFYDNRDRDVFQRDFEARFSIRRSTASNILGLMEKNGLITRVSTDNDARLKKIMLTERAVKIHEAILEDVRRREKRLSYGIEAEELEQFFRTIDKIKANLEDHND